MGFRVVLERFLELFWSDSEFSWNALSDAN